MDKHMRIDEVEDEHEQTGNEEDELSESVTRDYQQDKHSPSNYDTSPMRHHRSSNKNPFRDSGIRSSINKQTNRSMNSTHGMACMIDPELVEPQSPDRLDESLNEISPRHLLAAHPINIYIDKEAPVAVSGYF